MSVIELVRDIWMNNACVKFEERSLNPSKSDRANNEIVTRRRTAAVRLRCCRKHNIPENLRFSGI